jgi:hypothetical protein
MADVEDPVPGEIVAALVGQLQVTGRRLEEQVADLHRAHTLLAAVSEACATVGLEVPELERAAELVAVASAEVRHGVDAWRRAVHRMLSTTQPVSVREP